MATLHSFYLPPEKWVAPYVLQEDEAHHLVRVLRVKQGDTVRLFDGIGRFGLFTVDKTDKKSAYLSPQNEPTLVPAPQVQCTIAAGYSKAVRRSWFLEKAVELEASALWFWQGDYSQAKLPSAEKNTWQASLIAGAKQCENPWLPELKMLYHGVEEIIANAHSFTKVFVLYEGETGGKLLTKEDLSEAGSVLLIVGPEGGFSPKETALLQQAGIAHVSLGDSILRWETAAILTLGLAWWARQK